MVERQWQTLNGSLPSMCTGLQIDGTRCPPLYCYPRWFTQYSLREALPSVASYLRQCALNVDSRNPTIGPPTWPTLPPPFTPGPVPRTRCSSLRTCELPGLALAPSLVAPGGVDPRLHLSRGVQAGLPLQGSAPRAAHAHPGQASPGPGGRDRALGEPRVAVLAGNGQAGGALDRYRVHVHHPFLPQ